MIDAAPGVVGQDRVAGPALAREARPVDVGRQERLEVGDVVALDRRLEAGVVGRQPSSGGDAWATAAGVDDGRRAITATVVQPAVAAIRRDDREDLPEPKAVVRRSRSSDRRRRRAPVATGRLVLARYLLLGPLAALPRSLGPSLRCPEKPPPSTVTASSAGSRRSGRQGVPVAPRGREDVDDDRAVRSDVDLVGGARRDAPRAARAELARLVVDRERDRAPDDHAELLVLVTVLRHLPVRRRARRART